MRAVSDQELLRGKTRHAPRTCLDEMHVGCKPLQPSFSNNPAFFVAPKGSAGGKFIVGISPKHPNSDILINQDLVDMSGLTFQASNNLMNKFIAHGILSEATGQARNRVFRYDAWIALFD